MSQNIVIISIVAVAGCTRPANPQPAPGLVTIVERHTRICANGKLLEAIGVARSGGEFSPLIPAGYECPTEFTTAVGLSIWDKWHPSADSFDIDLYRGNESRVDSMHFLGRYRVHHPPAPAAQVVPDGHLEIAIDSDGTITLAATYRAEHVPITAVGTSTEHP